MAESTLLEKARDDGQEAAAAPGAVIRVTGLVTRFGPQVIQFDLSLLGGCLPLLGLLFPMIATALRVGGAVLKAFDLAFEFVILMFPKFHTGLKPSGQLSQRRLVMLQVHFDSRLR